MTLSEIITQLTGYLRASVRDVLAHGLRTFRTGASAVTVIGELLLMYGSVNADASTASEA